MGHTLLGAKNKAGKKRDKIFSSQVLYIFKILVAISLTAKLSFFNSSLVFVNKNEIQ